MPRLVRLLVPLALLAVVVFSAATSSAHRAHDARPQPQRSLTLRH